MIELPGVIGDYNHTAAAAGLALDLANGYRPFVATMPESSIEIPPLSTYEPRVSVPANSWLWAISAKSAHADGFTIQITDLSTRKPLFSEPIAHDLASGGAFGFKNCYGVAQTVRNPLHVLPKPLAVLTPGLLGVKLQNLAPANNRVRVALHFAIPTRATQEQPNEWNAELERELRLAGRAIRDAGSSVLSSAIGGNAFVDSPGSSEEEPVHLQFDVSDVGDNIIVAGSGSGKLNIYQLDLWNVAQQTIQFFRGSVSLRGAFTDFPALSQYGLALQDKPHFTCLPGQPFIIRLSGGTPVTGFIKYRLE